MRELLCLQALTILNAMGSYYTARYLKFNANTGSEEINGSTEDGHAITNYCFAITDNARILLLELTADEERFVAESYWRYRRFWSLLAMALLVSAAKETLMVRPKNNLRGL